MRNAADLHIFNPPEYGDEVRFTDGSIASVSQDGVDGWYLLDSGRRICQSGFDMHAFIRAVLAEDKRRQGGA
jgi:hypothetical protein